MTMTNSVPHGGARVSYMSYTSYMCLDVPICAYMRLWHRTTLAGKDQVPASAIYSAVYTRAVCGSDQRREAGFRLSYVVRYAHTGRWLFVNRWAFASRV